MTNKRLLKTFVRYDGQGRVVLNSLIARQKMPKVGKWIEIPAYQCCNFITNKAELVLAFLSIEDVVYLIDGDAKTINATVPFGTDVTALVATFVTSANITSITVGGVAQISGVTANDFSTPKIYVVVAQDGFTTINWIVTVTVANI